LRGNRLVTGKQVIGLALWALRLAANVYIDRHDHQATHPMPIRYLAARRDLRLRAITVLIIALVVCALRPLVSARPIVWSADLGLRGIADIKDRLQQPEPAGYPLEMLDIRDGRIVRQRHEIDCAGYLAAIDEGFLPVSTSAIMIESAFVRDCYLLRDLQTARPAAISHVPDRWPEDILTKLPTLLEGPRARGEERPQNLHPEHAWAGVAKSNGLNRDADTIKVEDDEMEYELQIVGRADFNTDDFEDLAAFGSSRSKRGSYRASRYFVLTRCRSNEQFRVVSASQPPYKVTGDRCP
jgi:hypothetical protein